MSKAWSRSGGRQTRGPRTKQLPVASSTKHGYTTTYFSARSYSTHTLVRPGAGSTQDTRTREIPNIHRCQNRQGIHKQPNAHTRTHFLLRMQRARATSEGRVLRIVRGTRQRRLNQPALALRMRGLEALRKWRTRFSCESPGSASLERAGIAPNRADWAQLEGRWGWMGGRRGRRRSRPSLPWLPRDGA